MPARHKAPIFLVAALLLAPWDALHAAKPDAGDYNLPQAESPGVYDPRQKSEMDELAPTEAMAAYNTKLTETWVVFTEDRAHSVRRVTALPQRWLAGNFTGGFKGSAQPGEFYVFQIVPYAAKTELRDVRVTFTDLKGAAGVIPVARLRCLSLGGNDFHGQPFTKSVSVPQSRLQPLWVGVDLARETSAGKYAGTATVACSAGKLTVPVELTVGGAPLDDHGDGDSWRLSRLRWLDSTIGLDDNSVTAPYTPVLVSGNTLSILGRDLELGADALPAQVRSYFNGSNTKILKQPAHDLLAKPMRLVIETDTGPIALKTTPLKWEKAPAVVRWTSTAHGGAAIRIMASRVAVGTEPDPPEDPEDGRFPPGGTTSVSSVPVEEAIVKIADGEGITVAITGEMEYDGYVNYRCAVTTEKPVQVKDIRLEFAVAKDCAEYFMGLGMAGGRRAAKPLVWSWNPQYNQDGFWMGAINGGFKIQFYGDNWRTPLINAYYHWRELVVPESWGGADGKSGRISVANAPDGSVSVAASSGARTLEPGKPLGYNFKLFLTPFKPLNTDEQWALRYFHKGQGVDDADYRDLKRVAAMGANVINIHHNKEQNPTINYPLFDLSRPLLKQCVEDAHSNNVKVKIYYTLRELTSNLPELFAFFSMNGELICPSPGKDGVDAHPVTNGDGPHPWLVDHLGPEGYIPAWREVIGGRYGGLLDLAIITTPDSRLCNFYLESLAFLLRETDFDGMYIDDTSLDRKTFQRAHRIFEKAGKPLLADLHSWSHRNGMAGDTSSAYLFMQNFPYYHRLWFGEGFSYGMSPDRLLIEQSGIPFGLMGEMLKGPNSWHGMIFGETGRLGWSGLPGLTAWRGDPRPIWKLWDEFGMAGTEMTGFWESGCPVKSGRNDIPVTLYRKPGKTLVAISSWSRKPESVKLMIDWRALGLDPAKAGFHAPAISGVQPEADFAVDSAIVIEPDKGWLLVLEETPRPSSAASPASSRNE